MPRFCCVDIVLGHRGRLGFGVHLLLVAGLTVLSNVALAHADPARVVRYRSSIKRRDLSNC